MDTLMIVLQVALAAVLAVAAYGKLRDLDGSRQAVREFGVPERFAPAFGTALPVIELGLALLLLPGATVRWAALATAMLFLAFIGGIGWNMSKGRHPDCHCFGQIHSEPAGWPTIIRNASLTLAALVVAWNGGIGPVEWAENLSDTGTIAAAVAVAVFAVGSIQSWLLLRLIRQNERLIDRIGSLQLEAPAATEDASAAPVRRAPEFDLPSLDGSRISLQGLLANGKPVLLVFADPGCGPCRALVPDIAEWQRRFADELTVAVISRGTPEENSEKFADHGVGQVAMQEEWEVYKEYEVRGTPSGVLVDPDGEIRTSFAGGRDNIRDLVTRAVSDRQSPPADQSSLDPGAQDPTNPAFYLHPAVAPDVGTSSTRLPLPDLDGGYVSLEDFHGQETTVLFWSADCGFCQRMVPDLKEWETEAGDLVDSVLIVSAGSTADNKAMGLRSKVVLDLGFNLGREFGATGTPSAIQLDAEGKIASPLAVGADAVLDLLYERSDTARQEIRF